MEEQSNRVNDKKVKLIFIDYKINICEMICNIYLYHKIVTTKEYQEKG